MIIACSIMLVVGMLFVASHASANGYLLVIRSRRHGLVLMEMGSDERYHSFAAYLLPLVVLRYGSLCGALGVLLLRRRIGGAAIPRRETVALGMKA